MKPQPQQVPIYETPVMTTQTILEPPPPRPLRAPPEELAEDITAMPLTLPDFANNIQPYLLNQNLSPRWIFTNPRRYAQAKAQGWRNCTRADLKASFAMLSPFEEEAGTKYINGDLILMLIDRKRYLGALQYKHQVADRLAQPAVQRSLSAARAQYDMGAELNAINQHRAAAGQAPVMEVFNPHADGPQLDPVLTKEAGKMGGSPDLMGGKAPDLMSKVGAPDFGLGDHKKGG